MMTSSESPAYTNQWKPLIVLTAAHFVLDMFPGMMHTVLPALQTSFGLSVASGAVLLTMFLVASNAIQVVIGHMRPDREKPLFLYAGMVLTCSILLFGLVGKGAGALVWLSLISLAAGAGVGMSHPEGLRAVHRLEGISPAVSSSVFMGGGVFGFAFGGLGGTYLFEHYGMTGLIPFCGLSLIVLCAMWVVRIRLAVEKPETAAAKADPAVKEISFGAILGMAVLAMGSVQVLMWIVPQHISRMGAELTLGGKTVSLFTLAGGIGGMLWARTAHRRGELKTIITMLAIGLPFVVLYLLLLSAGPVSLAAFAAGGFFCFGAYPIMVSLARRSRGPNLGRRMGLVVGGIWLAACILPMLLGPVAKQPWGTSAILYTTPAGFAAALALAIYQKSRLKKQNQQSSLAPRPVENPTSPSPDQGVFPAEVRGRYNSCPPRGS
jgi:MFS transporter, FSR family, fosmidomycin resistance protein